MIRLARDGQSTLWLDEHSIEFIFLITHRDMSIPDNAHATLHTKSGGTLHLTKEDFDVLHDAYLVPGSVSPLTGA